MNDNNKITEENQQTNNTFLLKNLFDVLEIYLRYES